VSKKISKSIKEEQNTHEYKDYLEEIKEFWLCKSKLEEVSNFPEITYEEYKRVNVIWKEKKNLDREVVKHKHIPQPLKYKNLQTLEGLSWLNDEVRYVQLHSTLGDKRLS
jgi:hypothetical protein